jgi:hypothetical protein
MKASMKHIKIPLAVLGIAALSVISLSAGPKRGTDILHLSTRKQMTDEGVVPNATGSIALSQNKQGNANNQRLDLLVSNLETNATYQLLAGIGDNPNLVQVDEFTTDNKGNANLRYRNTGGGQGKKPLPAELDPLANVRALLVVRGGNIVLSADMRSPDSVQYMIKRSLENGDILGFLRVKANTSKADFRLVATGLNPTNDYSLSLNGAVAQTAASDRKGRLAIGASVPSGVDALAIHQVALLDNTSTAVLTTTLP